MINAIQSDPSESGIAAVRILVVEDDCILCEALKKALESRGFSVVTAQNGPEGLRVVFKGNFNVVLCNWHMPGMDGGEFYRKVERVDPKLRGRFIFTTGFPAPSVQKFIQQINGTILSKPFAWSALLDAVSGLLARESSRVRQRSQ